MATEIQLRLITEGLEKAQKDIDKLEKSIQKTKEKAGQLSDEGKALDGVLSAFGQNAISEFQGLRKSGTDLLKNFSTLRTQGLRGLVSGFKAMSSAIAATGIGFLLTKVPELISAFSTLYDEITGVNDALREAEAMRVRAQNDAIEQEFRLAAFRAQRFEKTEESLRKEQKMEMDVLDAKIKAAERETNNEEVFFRLLNERSLKEIEHQNQIADFRAAKQAEQDKKDEEAQAKRDAAREAELAKEQERADALAALKAQARQRELQEEQEFEAKLEQMEEEAFLRTLSDEEREVLAVQDKYFQLLTEAEQFGMDTAFLEEEQQLALQEIRDKYAAERAEKAAADQEATDKRNDEALKKEKEHLRAIAEANESLEESKLNAVKAGLDALQVVAGDNEQVQNALFAAEKAVAVGEVIINNIKEKAANAAYAAGLGVAGPAYLAAQNTAANIRLGTSLATIAATSIARFMNGGGAGSAASAGTGGAGGVAVATPQQQTLTPITGEGIDTTGVVQPVQAYVIGQDITNQQALDSELRLRSTL